MMPTILFVLVLSLLPGDSLGCFSQNKPDPAPAPVECCACPTKVPTADGDRTDLDTAHTKYIWDIDCPQKVVCYFTSWSQFRKGNTRFDYSMMDANLCTHLIYSFLVLGPDGRSVVPHDAKEDFKFIPVLRKANPKLKIYAAVGGYKNTQTERREDYKALLKDSSAMLDFSKSAADLILSEDFDGLDLDYEFPEVEDKDGFTKWVRTLRGELTKHGKDLTMAVSASPWKLSNGYDMQHLAIHLDAVHVMAYDFHGSWQKDLARHHSPLTDKEGLGDVVTGVKYLLDNSVPPHKLILGIPMYGKYWNTPWSSHPTQAPPPVKLSPAAVPGGDLAYNEICQKVKNDGWTEVDNAGVAPYAFGDGKWVGYDTVRSIKEKIEYAVKMKLGGAMVWEVTKDDFKNICGKGDYPLIRSIRRTFRKACMKNEL